MLQFGEMKPNLKRNEYFIRKNPPIYPTNGSEGFKSSGTEIKI